MLWILAWRNLWRNRRRTLLTIAVLGLGLMLLVTMVSFFVGMEEMMVEQIARSSLGHLQLHDPEYLEKRSVRLVLRPASTLLAVVDRTPGVKASSARLIFTGAIRSSRSSSVQIVQVMAVDPTRERRFSALVDKVVAGGFVVPPPEALAPDAPERYRARKGILIGAKLARQLKVELGSKVRLDTAGFEGATTAAAFYVTGILQTGSDAFDRQLAMVSLADLQAASGAGDAVHEISVMAENRQAIPLVVEGLRAAIGAAAGEGVPRDVQVLPWWEVSPDLKQMLDLSSQWTGLLYLMMLVIMSAGILTTLFMVVYERSHEFGIQLALGNRASALFAGVMLEALYLGLISVGVGLAGGGLVVAYLATHGLDVSWLVGGFDFAGLFIENVYRGSAAPRVFVEPSVVVVLGTVLFALWPAMRVARMKPLDGIRQAGLGG